MRDNIENKRRCSLAKGFEDTSCLNYIIDLIRRIQDLPLINVSPRHELNQEILRNCEKMPEHLLKWGIKLVGARYTQEGIIFINAACERAHFDKKPGIIFKEAIKFFEENSFYDETEKLYLNAIQQCPKDDKFFAQFARFYLSRNRAQKAIDLLAPYHVAGQGNVVTVNTLGHAYIHAGQPQKAIDLLAPYHVAGQGDVVTVSTLGNAYIHAGQPQKAIDLLAPYHVAGQGNVVTVNTLGHAYCITKNRLQFDKVKDQIHPEIIADYLDAKLSYFENNYTKVQKILRPYMVGGTTRNNMIGLFLVSLDENSPLHDITKQQVGKDTYDYLIKRKDEWLNNPSLASFEPYGGIVDSSIYDYGAKPVDRVAASVVGLRPPRYN